MFALTSKMSFYAQHLNINLKICMIYILIQVFKFKAMIPALEKICHSYCRPIMKILFTLSQGIVFSTGNSAPSISRLQQQTAALQTRILASNIQAIFANSCTLQTRISSSVKAILSKKKISLQISVLSLTIGMLVSLNYHNQLSWKVPTA